ncbi:TVP38/TMEM64 family protein [Terrisporobacter sp.]
MEYIQNIYNLVNNHWILSIIVGFTSTFVESFLPALPLVAIVTTNAVLFGMIPGLGISWIGSSMGTICLFFVIKKISNKKFLKFFTNEKVEKAVSWVEGRGFRLLFLAYACPFLPACVVTISQGLSKRKNSVFISAVLAGKFVMFFIVSYIGKDIIGFIKSPIKVISLILITLIAWKVGNKLNKDLDDFEDKKHMKNKF